MYDSQQSKLCYLVTVIKILNNFFNNKPVALQRHDEVTLTPKAARYSSGSIFLDTFSIITGCVSIYHIAH